MSGEAIVNGEYINIKDKEIYIVFGFVHAWVEERQKYVNCVEVYKKSENRCKRHSIPKDEFKKNFVLISA